MNIADEKLMLPAMVAGGAVIILFAVRWIIVRFLRGWIEKSPSGVCEIVLSSIRTPSILWCVAIGIYIGASVSALHSRELALVSGIIHVIVILSVTVASANLAGRMFRNYVQNSNLRLPTSGLAYGILKGVIYLIGFSVILGVLGISIAPLLTALGVGGLAVALALKDTLANLFAGIHIMIEKSIRIGDFIKLESGQEGYVEDITWRTTRVRMPANNMVVIPNDKLAQSVVTNYSLPDRRMAVLIPVGVSYSSDPGHIEKILLEEAEKAVGDVPGLLAEPKPSVRFIPGFGSSSLDFTLACYVGEFSDQYLAQSELRKRIFKRFLAEGVDIPYPHQTVLLKKLQD
jgi:small-conductance mechanosensitive channel